MRLDISRMSRILPILSILILGGFQTTSALEYLITGTLGGTTPLGDQAYNQGTGIQTLNVFVYLKYTGAEIAGKGTGFLSGSLSLASSNDVVDVAVLNGSVPSTATTQAGVYAVQNAKANGTAGTGWNATTPISASFTDQSLLSATYAARGINGNAFGTTTPGTTYYLYLASATFTIDTSVPEFSQTTIGASIGTTNWAGTTAFAAPLSDSFFITVPEPTTYALAALSCVALGVVGRRKSLKAKTQETASA